MTANKKNPDDLRSARWFAPDDLVLFLDDDVVRADLVVNATGPWSEKVARMAGASR